MSAEAKFTPGPWRWEYYDLVSDAPGLNYGSRNVIELHDGTVYSEYSSDGASLDVTLPNAALIAAAPELYEALGNLIVAADTMLRNVDEVRERGEFTHWQSFDMSDCYVAITEAQTALSRAVPVPTGSPQVRPEQTSPNGET